MVIKKFNDSNSNLEELENIIPKLVKLRACLYLHFYTQT